MLHDLLIKIQGSGIHVERYKLLQNWKAFSIIECSEGKGSFPKIRYFSNGFDHVKRMYLPAWLYYQIITEFL